MFTVKATAELCGLTPETLRAWERRHGAVTPLRDGKGRRLYDTAMVERLSRLHCLVDRGHPISQIATLDDAALDALLADRRQVGFGGVEELPGRLLDAVADYQVDVFDSELTRAVASLPLSVLIPRVVSPLLEEVGLRWADGRLAVAQERLVSSLLHARLLSVLNQQPRGRRPRVLFATLPGERHELGLLGAALHAYEAGMPVLYLGPELPADELARVVGRLEAGAVAISSIYPGHAREALEELRRLDAVLPPGVPVWVGGGNARYLAEELRSRRITAVTDAALLVRLAGHL